MSIDECLTDPKKPHPKNPSVKSMAPPAPRECNQPAQRIASQTIRASHPVHRSALHRILCSAAHRANATSPRSVLHRKQSAHRIPCIAAHYIASCAAQRTARMQPARAQRIASQTIRAPKTSPLRIARRARCASPAARRTPRTCSSARASQYFALVSFGDPHLARRVGRVGAGTLRCI
jgi:hypothetical protein